MGFRNLVGDEGRERTEQSFFVPKEEIVQNDYDLSINKYKQTVYEAVEYRSAQEILTNLYELQIQFSEGMEKLKDMLGL